MWLRFVALLALWTSVAHISAVAGALEPALTPGSTGSDISVLTRETSLTTGKNSSILSPRSAISNHCTREHRALLHRRLTTLHIWCAEAIRTLTNTAANGPNHEAEFGRGGESLSPLSPAEISRLFRGTFLRDSERGRSYALEHYRSLEREAEWLSSDNPFRSVRSRLTIECDEGPAARRECGPEDKTMVRHAFGWQRGVILVVRVYIYRPTPTRYFLLCNKNRSLFGDAYRYMARY